MKYNVIEIRPCRNTNEWLISYGQLDGDREETETSPNSLGFYYHSEEMSKQEAFEKLKACIINKHKQQIKRLEDGIDSLSKLEINS